MLPDFKGIVYALIFGAIFIGVLGMVLGALGMWVLG